MNSSVDDAEELSHEQAIGLALVEARSAMLHGDVPVGAVVVVGGPRDRERAQRTGVAWRPDRPR